MTQRRTVQRVTSSFGNGVSSVFGYDVNGRMIHMERFKNGDPPTRRIKGDITDYSA
jgi:hypothetical protein